MNIVEIERTGSMNKAAKNLFISQSTLSRKVKEIEEKMNVIIFHRSPRGVVPTCEGKELLTKIHSLLEQYDDIESTFISHSTTKTITLKIATQRYSKVVSAFFLFYDAFCRKAETEYINIALYEDTTENIISLIDDYIYNIGIVHLTRDNEEYWFDLMRKRGITWNLVEESGAHVQIDRSHPLASQSSIRTNELFPYPHVTFADEDITSINYCSNIHQYNDNIIKKRIVVQDRGTLQQIIAHTDAYYIGTDLSSAVGAIPANTVFIPLEDIDIKIRTYWIYLKTHKQNIYEESFMKFLIDQTNQ